MAGRIPVALLGLALAALAVLPAGCKRADVKKGFGGPGIVPVSLATARKRHVPIQIRTFGAVEPYRMVAIRSQLAGELTGVYIEEGQEVKAGQLVFTIDSRLHENNLAAAKSRLSVAQANLTRDISLLGNAQSEFDRVQGLYKLGQFSAPRELAQAYFALGALKATTQAEEAMIDGEEAAVRTADLNLSYTKITSPIDGFVGKILFDKGNLVKLNDVPMVWINRVKPVFVSFSIPQTELEPLRRCMAAGKLIVEATTGAAAMATTRPGGPAAGAATRPDASGDAILGELISVSNEIDTTTGMIRVKAQFANADLRLWPGQFVNVTLNLSSEEGVVVPSQAVVPGQEGPQVFVAKFDRAAGPKAGEATGTVDMRPAVVGRTVDGWTVVDCVTDGERVVTDGQMNLTPASKIVEKGAVRGGATATPTPAPAAGEVVVPETAE
ncbi:MAG: efflux RND transporter periplasmic adaptor subunit [Phycisphaerae bacterium]|nr:efflux RND transporter periplasmic adaptor subunit [Phycisphaerae bacterium]